MRPFFVFALLLTSTHLAAQEPFVAPKAPRDRVAVFHKDGLSRLDSLVQPLIQQARATFPEARRRFQAGLPPRHGFFVTASLTDAVGNIEVVFIGVDSLARDSVFGRIWNQIHRVGGYRLYQPFALRESNILDWLITKPDGTEEGNLIGKFMESYQQ